ncbi:MAG TPA: M12 family metallo-peptidase [Candidatus Binatia bacterium]|nr:M12 family metallo-peptidase [Candidatus Binatia bacterium]
MRPRAGASARLFVAAIAIGLACRATAAERQVEILSWPVAAEDREASRASGVAAVPALASVERRAATVDVAGLAALAPGDVASLALPSGQRYRVRLDAVERTASGSTSWIARIADAEGPGDPDLPVVITASDGATAGALRTPAGDFRIVTDRDGTWLIDLSGPALAPADLGASDAMRPPSAASSAGGRTAAAESLVEGLALPPPLRRRSVVDLLVLTTPGLRARLGTGVRARIENLVAIANQAYAASGVKLKLRVVGVEEVAYPDGGSNAQALGQLTDGTHPALAPAHDLRDLYGADLVTLLRPFDNATHGGCGTGWVAGWGGVPVAYANGFGYSVVSDGESQGLFCDDVSFAHEISHNFGCMHDRPTVEAQGGGQGAYPFGFGYGVAGRFGTVMSYTFPRLARFSNPDRLCMGIPCGVDERAPTSANNALSLELTRADVALFRPAAELDFGFGDHGRALAAPAGGRATGRAVAVDAAGRVAVAGWIDRGTSRRSLAVARFLPGGGLDGSFGSGGWAEVSIPGARVSGEAVAVQPDGKLVVAGSLEDDAGVALAIVRLTADGARDAEFSRDGMVVRRMANRRLWPSGIDVDDAGRIAVAGTGEGAGPDAGRSFAFLARVRRGGALDRAFRNGLFEEPLPEAGGRIAALGRDPSGRLVVAGGAAVGTPGRGALAALRFSPDGELDRAFGDHGIATAEPGDGEASAEALAIAPDGAVVVAGAWSAAADGKARLTVARFGATGAVDRSFAKKGIFTLDLGDGDARLEGVALVRDGGVVAAGSFAARATGDADFVALRLRAEGRLQRGFGSGGATATEFVGRSAIGHAAALAPDGSLVVAGEATSASSSSFAIARYAAAAVAP